MKTDSSVTNNPKITNLAANYLFKIWHKGALLIIGALYIAHLLYVTYLKNEWQITPNNLYTPYSEIILAVVIIVTLSLIKRPNWKVKIKIIALVVTLSFLAFNTVFQLDSLFDQGTKYTSKDRAKNASGETTFDHIEQMSPWIKNDLHFVISYRIWAIVLLDLIAIFGFMSVNKILDSYIEDKK